MLHPSGTEREFRPRPRWRVSELEENPPRFGQGRGRRECRPAAGLGLLQSGRVITFASAPRFRAERYAERPHFRTDRFRSCVRLEAGESKCPLREWQSTRPGEPAPTANIHPMIGNRMRRSLVNLRGILEYVGSRARSSVAAGHKVYVRVPLSPAASASSSSR